jgi:hypothetical protein
MKSISETRKYHVGRCPRRLNPRGAVEVGQGDEQGRSALASAGYALSVEPGPIRFPPHAKECPWPKN